MGNLIHESSTVSNTRLGDSSIIYRGCRINDTTIGCHSFIGDDSVVKNSILGNYTQIARNSMVQYCDIDDYSYCGMRFTAIHCEIGKFCSISWNVSIGGANHDYRKTTTHSFLYDSWFGIVEEPLYNRFSDSCIIGNDVWIGSGVNVLRGVKIGDGAVVGAGTVVTKDVPPYAIVCGNPGKILKYRFDAKIITALEELRWWEMDSKTIRDNINLFNQDCSLEVIEELKTVLCRTESYLG